MTYLKSKLLIASVTAAVASTSFAGQEPYVATVGNDTETIPDFYLSPKLSQFTPPDIADIGTAPTALESAITPIPEAEVFTQLPNRVKTGGQFFHFIQDKALSMAKSPLLGKTVRAIFSITASLSSRTRKWNVIGNPQIAIS